MDENDTTNRCRLVLIAPEDATPSTLIGACRGGDVASIILPAFGRDLDSFQAFCEGIVPALQEAGVAVFVEGDNRVAARVKADGVHLDHSGPDLAEEAGKLRAHFIVGANGGKTRHEALEAGEAQPDYMFFGRIDYDRDDDPHPRNLALASWWAEMVEIPCIVQGGRSLGSLEKAARTGAEFVALSRAVFERGDGAGAAVAEANGILDRLADHLQ